MTYKIKRVGDQAVSIYFENKIDILVNKKVHYLEKALKQSDLKGVLGLVPAYQSLLIYFDNQKCDLEVLSEFVKDTLNSMVMSIDKVKWGYRIPVYYDGEDLVYVAEYHSMPINEVIDRHTAPLYYIYFLGFAPGFPYLGGLDPQLITPRLKNPKTKILAGSVGIADQQTGIYTVDSPGGWQVIGKTPLRLYSPNKNILEAGRYIQFYSVDFKTYEKLLADQDLSLELEVLE